MGYENAVLDFREARRRANREQFLARLTGKPADLLSFDEVRRMLGATAGAEIGLRDIPLDAIVGSLGRYADFTRSFLPKTDFAKERWARVQLAAADLRGLPPIEVYKIGDAYFVRDGNHRVSVARQLGAASIEAYVTEILTRVSLSPDVQPDELILKAEYVDLMQKTNLDEIRPDADLTVTAPGKYPALLEHIDVHRYFMGLDLHRDVSWAEAIGHWYDEVYLPVVRTIRDQQILADFPGRTETDLYLWVAEHRTEVAEELGWHVETDRAAADLAEQYSPTPQRRLARVAQKLQEALTPEALYDGPVPGVWRKARPAAKQDDRIFHDILVPVTGKPAGWAAVTQAVELAHQEGARLLGLHIVRAGAQDDNDAARGVQSEFDRQCAAAGVEGRLAIEAGPVARTICDRSRWADLVVVTMRYPPVRHRIARLGSGLRTLVRCAATPVLAVPGDPSPMLHPLLAYDGSAKAKEALYIAAYLVARRQVPLVVVSVLENRQAASKALAEAGNYLQDRGAANLATFVQRSGHVAQAIVSTTLEYGCDLVLMGGYRRGPILEVFLGSTVDQVLREGGQPILVCR